MSVDHELRTAGYSQEELYIYAINCELIKEARTKTNPVVERQPKKEPQQVSPNQNKFSPPEGLGYAIGLMF